MASRRGLLGAATALFATGRRGFPTKPVAAQAFVQSVAEMPVGPPPSDYDLLSKQHVNQLMKQFNKLSNGSERAFRRQVEVAHMHGGLPPHIACMDSNALWFKAISAARHMDKVKERQKSWSNRLKVEVFGKELAERLFGSIDDI